MKASTIPRLAVVLGGLAALSTGCGRDGTETGARGSADAAVRSDSAVMADAWAAFRGNIPSVSRLQGGRESRERLVQDFIAAVDRRDTSVMSELVLRKDEFAWLYYPTAREALPPYQLPPDLAWMTLFERSNRDVRIAFDELGGKQLRYLGHKCAQERAEGHNRLWGACVTTLLQGQDTLTSRLFGLIVERDGVFKFVSYANRLR